MLDKDSVDKIVASAIDAYDGSRQQLDALLRVLFVYRPAALTAFAADGRYTLERLRAADKHLQAE